MKKVGIIGLGWLGLPLAEKLAMDEYQVIGSTTRDEKAQKLSKEAYGVVTLHLNPHPMGKGFNSIFESETLIIAFPPKSRSQAPEFYFQQLAFLKKLIEQSKVKRVLFISSTGIYPKEGRKMEYDEEDEITKTTTGNSTLLEAERIISEKRAYELTIIRMGGLMGKDRIVGKYFEGKENVDGSSSVNYIHQDDAVRLCQWVIEENQWEELFNGVAPNHPSKKDMIEKTSRDFRFDQPKSYSNQEEMEQRIISSEKLIDYGFEFDFPNPLDFSYKI